MQGEWHTVVPELRAIVLSGPLGQAFFAGELTSVNIKSMSQDIDEIIAAMEYTERGIADVWVSKRKGNYNPIEAPPQRTVGSFRPARSENLQTIRSVRQQAFLIEF